MDSAQNLDCLLKAQDENMTDSLILVAQPLAASTNEV